MRWEKYPRVTCAATSTKRTAPTLKERRGVSDLLMRFQGNTYIPFMSIIGVLACIESPAESAGCDHHERTQQLHASVNVEPARESSQVTSYQDGDRGEKQKRYGS